MDGKNVMAIVNQIKKYDICIWIINMMKYGVQCDRKN